MRKAALAFLERVFAAEVEAAVTDQPIMRLVQAKNAVARQLAADGYLVEDEITLGGRIPIVVRGYVLTEKGRMTYCEQQRYVASER